jgi:hypothetical protein
MFPSRPVFRSIFRTQELAIGKSPAPADQEVGANTRGDNPTTPVGQRGALLSTRPTITGEAIGGGRLPTAHLMALVGHTPILAHPQEKCYVTTTISAILYVTVTIKMRVARGRWGKS